MFNCPQSQENSAEDTVLFKARIVVRVPVSITDANDVVDYINDWAKLRQNITITLVVLTVDPSCPAGTESDSCVVVIDQSISNDDSSDSGAIIGAVLAGVFVVIALLVLVVVIVLVCIQRRRSRYSWIVGCILYYTYTISYKMVTSSVVFRKIQYVST